MSLTGQAKIAGVAGWPVGHSLSPRLHGYWIAEYKLDAAYIPLPIRPEDFAPAVALLPKLGLRGLNVTIPHKEAAFALATEQDEAAKATGAVNTLIFEDGRIVGKNTDVAGVIGMLHDAGIATLAGKHALVYGAGGAARAVVLALTKLQAAQIFIANRTQSKAQDLAKRFSIPGSAVVAVSEGTELGNVDVLINTTSVGMIGKDAGENASLPALRFDAQPGSAYAIDIVYRPLETPFLSKHRKAGLKIVDGLGMLLHQAVPAFKAWFGIEPKVTPALRAHMIEALKD
ncbi:MAG: shikimate dehydrogenase [Alphaproteobacteria bacterium]|nr:shikimate dehydrogenase [Alphaproteobacteria bacterium]